MYEKGLRFVSLKPYSDQRRWGGGTEVPVGEAKEAERTTLTASRPLGSCKTTEGGTGQKEAIRWREGAMAMTALEIYNVDRGDQTNCS